MKIVIGIPPQSRPGGIGITESAFILQCTLEPGVDIKSFEFGSGADSRPFLRTLVKRSKDFFDYLSYLGKRGADIIHLNSAFDRRALLRDVFYTGASRLMSKHLFLKLHGSDARLVKSKALFWRIVANSVIRNSTAIGVLSKEERQNFVSAGFPADKIVVVKNLVPVHRFQGREAGPKRPRQALFISRFIVSKGLLDTIQALRLILDRGQELTLVCVGDGPLRNEAENLAEKMNVQDHVQFTGRITEEDAIQYYLNSSMFVLPTWHEEGFSMAVFQAVAAGLPILTSKLRAAADYLEEPRNCLWVEPRNHVQLAGKIEELLCNPDLMQKMSINNRLLAQEFAPERVAKEYLALYRNILSGAYE